MGNAPSAISSSLTIVNDTEFDFSCMVGPDQAALAIFSYVAIALGGITAIALSGGLVAPVALTSISSSIAAITGMTVALAKAIVVTVTVVGAQQTVVRVLDKIVLDQVEELKKAGFTYIPRGERHTYGGKTISLWQQGNCKRIRRVEDRVNGKMATINDEVFMRPIFTGATFGSNLDHSIQFWIDKHGFENEMTVFINPPDGRSSWGNLDATMEEFEALFSTSAPTDSPTTLLPTMTLSTSAPTTSTPTTTVAPTGAGPATIAPTAAAVPSTTAPTTATTIAPTMPLTIAPSATASTIAPTSTMTPVTIVPTVTVPFKCNVCMFSLTGSVANPDAIISIPGNGNFTCAEIENAGNNGLINEINCPLVIQFLRPCGCYLPYQQCWDPLSVVAPPEEPRPSSKSGKSKSIKH
jgi:hypothetical protein